jgi:hypothetical protein
MGVPTGIAAEERCPTGELSPDPGGTTYFMEDSR